MLVITAYTTRKSFENLTPWHNQELMAFLLVSKKKIVL